MIIAYHCMCMQNIDKSDRYGDNLHIPYVSILLCIIGLQCYQQPISAVYMYTGYYKRAQLQAPYQPRVTAIRRSD